MTCTMMMSLGVYVLGAADTAERQRLEAHLPTCPACRAELTRLAPLPGLLAGIPETMRDTARSRSRPASSPGRPAWSPGHPAWRPGDLAVSRMLSGMPASKPGSGASRVSSARHAGQVGRWASSRWRSAVSAAPST